MLFSIITVSYNNREGLAKTVKSVLGQTFTDYEYLVIDGGSTDGSAEDIRQVADRLGFWCSEPDGGIYPAMNKGVAKAKGDYVLFLNSGDCFHSANVLEKVSGQLDNKDIVSGYALRTDGKILNVHEDDVLMLLLHSTFSHQATFIRRSLFDNYQYDPEVKIIADWKAWVDWVIGENRSWKYIDTVVCDYDIEGVSSSTKNWDEILRERRAVWESFLPTKVVDQLYEDNSWYLSGHTKYISGHPVLRKLLLLCTKVLAGIGKTI